MTAETLIAPEPLNRRQETVGPKPLQLVFFDTEFTELGPWARWISIGLVSEDGARQFYAELSDTWSDTDLSPFARAQVLPHLDPNSRRITQRTLAKRLTKWLDDFEGPVQLVTDSEEWDWRWIQQLYWYAPWPAALHAAPLTLIFDINLGEQFANAIGRAFASGAYRRHHALDDAKVNRLGWLAVQGGA